MTIKHAYPGTFSDQYDDAQADAMAAGVCPKVMHNRHDGYEVRPCGRERVEGSIWCRFHKLSGGCS